MDFGQNSNSSARYVEQSNITVMEIPTENVEEMHNVCVRFRKQLRTLEAGKHNSRLNDGLKYRTSGKDTDKFTIIALKNEVDIDDTD